MTDMLRTIEPRSDQLNADDLLGARTLTITVSSVTIMPQPGGVRAEALPQPVSLHYEGDNGKPYKPCKSMRRVIVTVWGPDANLYVGRRMTLYRDDGVMFGGVAVGGIRISHISGIDKERTIALTASRAVRKPYTVQPMADELSGQLEAGQAAAEAGILALEAFWKGLTAAERKMIGMARLDAWKAYAAPHTRFPAGSGAGADLHDRQDTGGESSQPPVSDDANNLALDMMSAAATARFDKLLSDGRAAATNGVKALKTWYARLNAPDAEMMQEYADGLKKVAAQADALRA